MSNITKIKIIFFLHFVFALVSHLLAPIMIIGIFKLLFVNSIDFWSTGLILGATLFSATYIINHVTQEKSFCVLTDLENYYRKKEGMEEIKDFLPRFYKYCKILTSKIRHYVKGLYESKINK